MGGMQIDGPGERNGWPPDMVIRIDQPSSLLYLLYVRAAWRLPVAGVPEVDPVPEVGSSARPAGSSVEELVERWVSDWSRAMEPFGQPREVALPDAATQRALEQLSDGELAEWASRRQPRAAWDAGVDREAEAAWSDSLRTVDRAPLEEQPERRCLDALVRAWCTGLTSIIELPYRGYFAERIDPTTLIVSAATRHREEWYSRALSTPVA